MAILAEVSKATFEDFIDFYPKDLKIHGSCEDLSWFDFSLSENKKECKVAEKTVANDIIYTVNQDLLQQVLNKNI